MEKLKKNRGRISEHERFIRFLKRVPVLTPPEIYERMEELGYRGQKEPRRAVSLMEASNSLGSGPIFCKSI